MGAKNAVKIFLVALLAHATLPALVFSQADFYQGKTIRIIHGRDPGGSGDLRVKAATPVTATRPLKGQL